MNIQRWSFARWPVLGRTPLRAIPFAIILLVYAASSATAAGTSVQYAGVNLPVAAFGRRSVPGTYGMDYIYPAAVHARLLCRQRDEHRSSSGPLGAPSASTAGRPRQ